MVKNRNEICGVEYSVAYTEAEIWGFTHEML